MSKTGMAHMLLYPGMVRLLAYHQVLCYCSLAKPNCHSKSKNLASQDYTVVLSCCCGHAEISASPVSSL